MKSIYFNQVDFGSGNVNYWRVSATVATAQRRNFASNGATQVICSHHEVTHISREIQARATGWSYYCYPVSSNRYWTKSQSSLWMNYFSDLPSLTKSITDGCKLLLAPCLLACAYFKRNPPCFCLALPLVNVTRCRSDFNRLSRINKNIICLLVLIKFKVILITKWN